MHFHDQDCLLCKEQRQRIDDLSDLLKVQARAERDRMRELRKIRRTLYQEEKDALFFVTEVNEHWMSLEADDGTPISPISISPELARVVRVNDGLAMMVKLYEGSWRITTFEWASVYESVEVDMEEHEADSDFH